MERFVCVRVVQGWGMDLSLFQFDYRSTWAAFFMNADRSIYGRYSARDPKDLEGFAKALEGALELHSGYPGNKAELAGKTGPPAPWKTAEEIPQLRRKGKFREADAHKGCIHCHNVEDGWTKSLRDAGQPVPDRLMARWPRPERMGVTLAPGERAAVIEVQKGTPADKAGFRPGDRLVRLGGQPLLSVADVEWALYVAPDSGDLKARVDRAGETRELTVTLPPGWRFIE